MKWTIGFASLCVAAVAVILLGVWLLGGFAQLGLTGHGITALILGITITVALGIGLMALVFVSGRSRHDEAVHHDPTGTAPPKRPTP